jgi:hypothetical protein
MKQKSLLVLSGVTVGAIAVALFTSRGDESSASASIRGPLFPELKARVNDVARVRIEKAGKTVTLARDGGTWELADRGGYPAKFEEVKELVVRVAGLEVQEKLTAKKENHAKLAVEWPTTAPEGSEAGEAGLVTLEDASGGVLASLVVGKTEWQNSKPKVFVRKADEDQVWLAEPPGTGSLDVMPEPRSWIEPGFLTLENDRVQSVTIEHADGERVEIARSAADHTKFAVQNLPPGRNERYAGIANGPAQALSSMSLEDVRPVAEVDFALEPVATTRYRTTDGLEVVVHTSKFEDQTWMKVSASYTAPPAAPAGEPDDAPGEAEAPAPVDPAAAAEDAPADAPVEPEVAAKDVAAEAAELQARLAPWAFQVGSYKTDVIARRMQDLMAELPTESDESGSLEGMAESMGLDFDEQPPAESPVEPTDAPADEEHDEHDGHDHPAPPPPPPADTPEPEETPEPEPEPE